MPDPGLTFRDETLEDAEAIRSLITEAFRDAAHSSGTEAQIVDDLRAAGALTLSLVAEDDDGIAGHLAASPATSERRPAGPALVRSRSGPSGSRRASARR